MAHSLRVANPPRTSNFQPNYPTRPLEACKAYETSGMLWDRPSNALDVAPPPGSSTGYLDDDVQVVFKGGDSQEHVD